MPALNGRRAGWATLSVSLRGTEVRAAVMVYTAPETRQVAPGVVPIGGGAVMWLTGADLRSGRACQIMLAASHNPAHPTRPTHPTHLKTACVYSN